MTYFSGRVNTVIYRNDDDGFFIFRMVLDGQEDAKVVQTSGWTGSLAKDPTTTVRGHVQGLPVKIGTWFGFEAKWTNHAKYGKQLHIQKAPVLKNGWDAQTAESILVANGVGSRMCAQIRAHFGDDEFVKALSSAEEIEKVEGIAQVAALHVAQRWESVLAHFKTLDFLSDLGLPNGRIRQVWGIFGDDTARVLSKDPWALVRVDGVTFEHADEVARKLGLSLDGPERIRGATLFAAKAMRNFGHVFMRTGSLLAEVRRMAGNVSKAEVAKALAECHKAGTLVLDRTTRPGTTAVYEPWMHTLESIGGELLLKRATTAQYDSNPDPYLKALQSVGPKTEDAVKDGQPLEKVVEIAVSEWGEAAKLVLGPEQRRGVVNALFHPVSVLTGLPGTGKTTSLKAAVTILQDSGIPFLLCAPTGIAAKNLGAVTGARASTIHRAFSAKGSSSEKRDSTYAGIVGEADGSGKKDTGEGGDWGYDEARPYPAEVVIIDEASMIDQHLLYRLVTCTSPQCRLVFVGDHAQLPSVGPGNVLRNIIDSGQFPVVALTDIYRQKGTSDIVHAAHAIHRGDVPDTDPPSDFVLLSLQSEVDVHSAICSIAEKLYNRRTNFQILSPRHAGTVGVTNLNASLRELLNPRTPGVQEAKLGKDVIRENDRVMVIKNNYEKGVFNGDVGKINRVDQRAKEVEIKVFGAPPMLVRFPYKDLGKFIRLAYACTVHKAQGLEYNVIVMPIVDGFRHQLQRNLLYTAVTRAREKVYLVGTRSALAQAVSNAKEDLRDTLLVERLR